MMRSAMPARSKRLAPRSAKTTVRLREYRKAADAYLAEHPRCQFPLGCASTDVSIHHLGGRIGLRLFDVALWRASCNLHNCFAEDYPLLSERIGWRVNRVARRAA